MSFNSEDMIDVAIVMIDVAIVVIPALAVIVGEFILGGYIARRLCGAKGRKPRVAYIIITALCAAIGSASFFTNFGWRRFFLLIIGVSVLYLLLFITSGMCAAYSKPNIGVLGLWIAALPCFLGANLLLDDGGDYGGSYMFFGTITEYPDYFNYLAVALWILSVVLMVLQLVIVEAVRKRAAQAGKL